MITKGRGGRGMGPTEAYMREGPERNGDETGHRADVLIVGSGPAGLVMAISLARLGISSILVDKHSGTSIFPRATGISSRTMEIVRSWGLEDRVRQHEFDALPLGRTAETLASIEGVISPLGFPTRADSAAVSPTSYVLQAQDSFESVLLEHLRTYGSDIRFATRLVGFRQDETGVTSTLMHRTSRRRTVVRSSFLIGADGSTSIVRSRSGVGLVGPDNVESYVSTLFDAPLSLHLPGPRYALSTVSSPVGPAFLMPTDDDDRWVFAYPRGGDPRQPHDHSRQQMSALIRAATGVADLPVDVLSVTTFPFAAQVADRFRVSRAFLVGDAAHPTIPFGGNGLDAAVHDSHNLAWKLAYVLRGWATSDLLDAYERERRPVAEREAQWSMVPDRWDETDPLEADLGVTYETGALVHDRSGAPTEEAPWQQTARPGSRAPHLWLGHEGGRISTLDLFDDGLTVLTGSGGGAWRQAAAELGTEQAVALRTHAVGGPHGLRDFTGRFAALYGIEENGAVLVRPDGYVAWRAPSAIGLDVLAELRRGVGAALGQPSADRRYVRTVA